jgi:hypothetical protein
MANCAHKDPPEIMAMAEAWLRDQGITDDRWPGIKVRHAENTPGAMWESVVIDIERRGDQWIVTRLDRNRTPVEGALGLQILDF